MALRNPGTTASNALEERIRRHRTEMARRQPDQRDPAQELGALHREEIGLAALRATYEEYRQDKFSWLEDDG